MRLLNIFVKLFCGSFNTSSHKTVAAKLFSGQLFPQRFFDVKLFSGPAERLPQNDNVEFFSWVLAFTEFFFLWAYRSITSKCLRRKHFVNAWSDKMCSMLNFCEPPHRLPQIDHDYVGQICVTWRPTKCSRLKHYVGLKMDHKPFQQNNYFVGTRSDKVFDVNILRACSSSASFHPLEISSLVSLIS